MKETYNNSNRRVAFKSFNALIAILFLFLAIVFCLLCAVLTTACSANKSKDTTALIYDYDAENDRYTVIGVKDSAAQKLIIPSEYNGKKVAGFSCNVFANSRCSEYEYSSDIAFTDTHALASIEPSNIKLSADRHSIDNVRKRLYDVANDETIRKTALTLANGTTPSNLEENENYITFNYDWQAYVASGENVLPIFICPSGTVFNFDDYSHYDYIACCDKTSVAHLDRAYTQANGFILSDIAMDGVPLASGYTVSKNETAWVSFEKVYRIYVQSGNDDNYDITAVQPDFCYDELNGKLLSFKYVSESNADDYLNSVKQRNGYTLSWEYSPYNDGQTLQYNQFNTLSSVLSFWRSDLNISPVWTENAFEVVVSTSAENDTITYGDNVTLYANAPEMNGVNLTYEWRHNGKIFGSKSSLELTRPSLSGAYDGLYSVTVCVADDDNSSVKAYAEITLNIRKLSVGVVWSDSVLTYNGDLQYPTAQAFGLDGENLINGMLGGGINAGAHNALAVTHSANYELANAQKSFAIAKAKLTVKACDCTVVYGNEIKANGVQCIGLAKGDDHQILKGTPAYSFTNTSSQVGIYADCVKVDGLFADNYEIAYASGLLEIVKRTVELGWNGHQNLVYDGQAKCVTAAINNVVGSDDLVVTVSGGNAVNAGKHTAVAYLSGADKGNYELIENTFEYMIDKAVVPLKVWLKDSEYGAMLTPVVSGNLGNGKVEFAYGVSPDLLGSVSRLGAGSYYVVATAMETANYKSANAVFQFKILPKPVSLEWQNNAGLVYDAAAKCVSARVVGVLLGDDVSVQVAGGNGVNAGSYTAVASLVGKDAHNYLLPDMHTCTYVINKCALRIVAENKSSVYAESLAELTAVVQGKIYNGEVTYFLRKQAGTDAGSYAIDVAVGQYSNYDITAVSGTYTITKATPEIAGIANGQFDLETASGNTLGSITASLPTVSVAGSWSWDKGEDFVITDAKKQSFIATFKPTDFKNYEDVQITVMLTVKKPNDFSVTLAKISGEYCELELSEPNVFEWDGEPFVIMYMLLDSSVDDELLTVSISRSDGLAADAEYDEIEISLKEKGTYIITFEYPGNDEYVAAKISVTVVLE